MDSDAVFRALQDATKAARATYGLKGYFRKADRIKRKRGWLPWWERRDGNSYGKQGRGR